MHRRTPSSDVFDLKEKLVISLYDHDVLASGKFWTLKHLPTVSRRVLGAHHHHFARIGAERSAGIQP